MQKMASYNQCTRKQKICKLLNNMQILQQALAYFLNNILPTGQKQLDTITEEMASYV